MRKLRDDSTWNQLTPEQRETMESWLFDENLGYEKTLARVKEEFGFESTIASMGRYYRRRARERQPGEMLQAQIAANDLNDLPVKTDDLRAAAMKLVGKAVLKLATEEPDELQQLASLAKLLLDSEENELRRERLRLAEKCFHLESIAAIQKELPRLKAYLAVVANDASLSHDEKMNSVRTILFGLDRVEADNETGKSRN